MNDTQEPSQNTEGVASTQTPTEPVQEVAPVTTDETPVMQETVQNEVASATVFPYRNIRPGMVVRVNERIKDLNAKGEERQRVQAFEGTVLGLSGDGIGRTMTVRKISNGVGVEKIYPLASPSVESIDIVKRYRVRRAKLWFLRRDKKQRKMQEIDVNA